MKSENSNVMISVKEPQAEAIIHISVPSKTFLLGEYVALMGGPVIVLTTDPRFELIATFLPNHKTENIKEINAESPAGQFLQKNADFFSDYQLKFIDPYQGLGGFGASSAEFVMLAALKHYLCDINIDEYQLLNLYQTIAWQGEGFVPSGADLIAQLEGGICFFSKSQKIIKNYSWPFDNIEYCLVHTGHKIPTHEHLKQVKLFNGNQLAEIVYAGQEGLENKNAAQFIDAINRYADALRCENLISKETQKILKLFHHQPNILATKGCGALGADVVLVIFEKKIAHQLIEWMQEKKLRVIQYGTQTARGLNISVKL